MAKKNNIIRRVEDIDEAALLASMAGLGEQEILKISTDERKEESTQDKQSEPEEVDREIPKLSSKSKSESAYKSVFLQPRALKARQCVYISMDVHDTIVQIVSQIADKNLSVGVYVDTVLREHFEANKQEINVLYRKKKDDLIK